MRWLPWLDAVANGEVEFGINIIGALRDDLKFPRLWKTHSSWPADAIIPWRQRFVAVVSHSGSFIATVKLIDPVVTRSIGIVVRRGARLSPSAVRFREMHVNEWHEPHGV